MAGGFSTTEPLGKPNICICIIGAPKKKEKRAENMSNEIKAEKFPNFKKATDIQVQKYLQNQVLVVPNKMNLEIHTKTYHN